MRPMDVGPGPWFWAGNDSQSRDELLYEIWRRMNQTNRWGRQTRVQDIQNDIYDLATRGALRGELPQVDARGEDEYRYRLRTVHERFRGVDDDRDGPWVFYSWPEMFKPVNGAVHRRVALHVQPNRDAVLAAVKFVIQRLLGREYVREFKVSMRLQSALERLDTIEIYFEDPPGTPQQNSNARKINEILLPLDVRAEGHPAMLQSLSVGVGTGDEPPRHGVSFSDHRAEHIAITVFDHFNDLGRCSSAAEFAQSVRAIFQRNAIDFHHPSRNLET